MTNLKYMIERCELLINDLNSSVTWRQNQMSSTFQNFDKGCKLRTRQAQIFIDSNDIDPDTPLLYGCQVARGCIEKDRTSEVECYSIMRNTLAFPGSLASLSKCFNIHQKSTTYIELCIKMC